MAREVVVSVRLSEAEAAEVDAARGTAERGAWLREAALEAAWKPPGKPARRPPASRPAPLSRRSACPHPPRRVLKGLCGACGTYVGQK